MIIQSAGGLLVFMRDRWVRYEKRQMINCILTRLG